MTDCRLRHLFHNVGASIVPSSRSSRGIYSPVSMRDLRGRVRVHASRSCVVATCCVDMYPGDDERGGCLNGHHSQRVEDTSMVHIPKTTSATLDNTCLRENPSVRCGRSPRGAIPTGNFSGAGGERGVARRRCAKEVEDGRFTSRVARDIGGVCPGESIDALG